MIAQIIIICMWMIGTGVNLSRHGEKRERTYNIWTWLVILFIYVYLLYLGSFWDCFLK
jgi:hypothetical protein